MGDVNLEVELDQQGLNRGVRRTERTLEQMERRLSRRRARARLRRIREERRTEQRVTREREREERNRLRMERRLSRRRARARLRQIRARQREEARLEREAERQRERRRERRRAIARGGIGGLGRLAGGAGFAVAGATLGTLSSLFDADQVLEFNRSLALLAGQADITRKEQAKLAESITQVSIQTGKARTEVLAGFEAIIEKSGDFELAEGVILNVAKASVGLGADVKDLGTLAAALGSAFNSSGKEVSRFFEVLAAQGDKGQITLRDLAQIGEEVFTTAAGAGFKGEGVVTSLGALIQTGIGSADERKTAINNLIKLLSTDADKIEKKLGIKVKEKGEFRNPAEIVKDIIRKTKGDVGKIKAAGFSDLTPFLATASQFRDTGGFGKLETFLQAGQESRGLIQKRFERVESTAAVITLEKIQNIVTLLSDKALAPALNAVADSLQSIVSGDLDRIAVGFEAIGKGMGILIEGIAGFIEMIGKAAELFGLDFAVKKKALPKSITPKAKAQPVKEKQEQQGNAGNMKLNVNNNVTVDDRGNVKKSRTRVDVQNDSNVGRTLGVVGQ